MAEINDCSKCGHWACQEFNQGDLYRIHCANDIEVCGNEGPEHKDSDESIRLWNEQNPCSPATTHEGTT